MEQPLTTIVVTVAAGIFALVIGEKTRLPSIIFFLAFGLLLGPEGANLVQPGVFRADFPDYIELLVALILFEGGASLRFSQFREISGVVRNLLTLGLASTLISVTLLAHLLAGLSWTQSILLASIMVVTGPTVVQPILRRVRIKDNLHNVLKWEAILIDPLGVVIAVVLFEILLVKDVSLARGALLLVSRIAAGIILGLAAGWLMLLGLSKTWLVRLEGEELGGLYVLGLNLLFFGIAEWMFPESGLVCATVAGILIGNRRFAFKDQILHFKLQITLFALSILFILIASNLPLRETRAIIPQGLALLLGIILIARPLSILVSTGAERGLTIRDKVFLAGFAPRGIVSASLASLFDIAFREQAMTETSGFLPLTFFLIAGTIVFYAFSSGAAARLLGVKEGARTGVLVVGANSLGLSMAKELRARGCSVTVVDTNPFLCERARQAGLAVHEGSGFDRDFIESLDLRGVAQAVAMTANHEVNVLCCQNLARQFGRHMVFRLWGKGDQWGVVSSMAYDRSWGRPLVTGNGDREPGLVGELTSERLGIYVTRIPSALRVTPTTLAENGIHCPLFAWNPGRVVFPVPNVLLPAGSEIIALRRSVEVGGTASRRGEALGPSS
jgi:NhaP-type Na+/H+ or K+/H+ antiporter